VVLQLSSFFGYFYRIAFMLLFFGLFFALLDRARLGHSSAYAHAGKYPALKNDPKDEKNDH
jgi:hypothetical protein